MFPIRYKKQDDTSVPDWLNRLTLKCAALNTDWNKLNF